jgi:serpin B
MAITTLLVFSGCQIYAEDEADQSLIESKLQRDTNPYVSDEDFVKLATNNNEFAFDMYHQLSNSSFNIFFSPLSISEALVMSYAGADGSTKTQMAQALKFSLDDDTLYSAFNKLDLHLNRNDTNNSYIFSVVNALWPEKSYSFEQSYLDTIKTSFDSGLRLMDYLNESEKSRTIINDWVQKSTNEKIQEIVPPGAIDQHTKLVLTNAVYFKAKWAKEFNLQNTIKREFTLLNGEKKDVDMMYQHDGFIYSEGENYQAATLPYKGGSSSMVIILPKEGSFEEISNSIDNDFLKTLEDNKTFATLNLSMPKFEFTVEESLISPLNSLGINDAFTHSANFSKMSKTNDLFISDILHKAYIKVDEDGTEAAAATSIMFATTGIVVNVIQRDMNLNRPFIFFIKDNFSGQILFLGNILDPS